MRQLLALLRFRFARWRFHRSMRSLSRTTQHLRELMRTKGYGEGKE